MKILNTDINGNNIPVTVFKNEKDGKTRFSIGISHKKQDGTYENGYILAQFKKSLNAEQNLHNKDKIILNNAILDFWTDDKKNTNLKIFVFDYSMDSQENNENSFVTIDDGDLPF